MQQKLKGILEKTKNRLRNQGLNKDSKFAKKFDKFQDLDTFIDIKDLIANLIKKENE